MNISVISLCLLIAGFAGELHAQDVCSLPAETGPCKAFFTRYFYNPSTGTCDTFTYGGCRGNGNNFVSAAECSATCQCNVGVSRGNRRSSFGDRACFSSRAFYYDTSRDRCRRFSYRGCNGNGNRFLTSQQCRSTCQTSMCFLAPETGSCRAAFPRYFYNSTSQACEQFVYGGCRGNTNRFSSLRECDVACTDRLKTEVSINIQEMQPREQDPVCLQRKMVGRCRAAFRRFYFNTETGLCEQFIYGGCGGNGNNFRSEADCQQTCETD